MVPEWCKHHFSARAEPFPGAGLTPGQVCAKANRQLGSTGQQKADTRESPHIMKISVTAGETRPLASNPGLVRVLRRAAVGKNKPPPFAQGSPVFLRQCGNEARVRSAHVTAPAQPKEHWLFFREEQLGLHNGLQLSRII